MVQQYQQHISIKRLCKWVSLPSSSFYYQPLLGKVGAKASIQTKLNNGAVVTNDYVVAEIKTLLSQEFVCYGYQKITASLRQLQYVINEKKVYRLMNENNLLLGKVIKTTGKRQFVKHRKISAQHPMDYICLDIKYLWVQGENRWYYLLSVIDVYSRKVIAWILQRSVKQIDVINLFRKINEQYPIKGVNIRNDNGSQFIANSVKQFLFSAEAKQEFTHIATPQENSYIEAYHSILQSEIVERFELSSFYEAKQTITQYVEFYNTKRLHGSLKMQPPQKVWDNWTLSQLNKPQMFIDTTDALSTNSEQKLFKIEESCFVDNIFKEQKFSNFNDEKQNIISNHLEKNIQQLGG